MQEDDEKKRRNWSAVKRSSTHQVNIRLTAEEAERLNAVVEAAGVSLAGYVKAAALNRPAPKAVRRVDANAAALRQLLGQMGKLGSNANQIARAANSGTLDDVRQVKRVLEAIDSHLVEMRLELLKTLNIQP